MAVSSIQQNVNVDYQYLNSDITSFADAPIGCFRIQNIQNMTDAPSGSTSQISTAIIWTMPSNSSQMYQVLFVCRSGKMYTRGKYSTWMGWKEVALAVDWTSCADYKSSAESDAVALLMLYGKQRTLSFQGVVRTHAEGDVIMTLPAEHRPVSGNPFGIGVIGGVPVILRLNSSNGQLTIYLINGATSSARLYFSMSWVAA